MIFCNDIHKALVINWNKFSYLLSLCHCAVDQMAWLIKNRSAIEELGLLNPTWQIILCIIESIFMNMDRQITRILQVPSMLTKQNRKWISRHTAWVALYIRKRRNQLCCWRSSEILSNVVFKATWLSLEELRQKNGLTNYMIYGCFSPRIMLKVLYIRLGMNEVYNMC